MPAMTISAARVTILFLEIISRRRLDVDMSVIMPMAGFLPRRAMITVITQVFTMPALGSLRYRARGLMSRYYYFRAGEVY